MLIDQNKYNYFSTTTARSTLHSGLHKNNAEKVSFQDVLTLLIKTNNEKNLIKALKEREVVPKTPSDKKQMKNTEEKKESDINDSKSKTNDIFSNDSTNSLNTKEKEKNIISFTCEILNLDERESLFL
ncbi:hypothetical protein ACLM5H_13045 [Fredinandcohnia humi]